MTSALSAVCALVTLIVVLSKIPIERRKVALEVEKLNLERQKLVVEVQKLVSEVERAKSNIVYPDRDDIARYGMHELLVRKRRNQASFLDMVQAIEDRLSAVLNNESKANEEPTNQDFGLTECLIILAIVLVFICALIIATLRT